MNVLNKLKEQIVLIQNESNNSIKKIEYIQIYLSNQLKKAWELHNKKKLSDLPDVVDILSEAKTLIEKIDDIIPDDFEEYYD